MKIIAVKPRRNGEHRAPITPDTIKKLSELGLSVGFETGLGLGQSLEDVAMIDAGGKCIASDAMVGELADAAMVLTLEPLAPDQINALQSNAVVIGMLEPITATDELRRLIDKKITAIALEFLPRISRAQAMDVLSSQASIGGYKAVLIAAERCPKMLPMMMTAAGTLSAARVFVLGAGVAGLQAIATAKRLGAIVEAYDVRAVTREQVQSLGARFVEMPDTESAETTGGYAKEQTAEQRHRQTEFMGKHIAASDIVITTAAVFGKAPPMLISADVVERMQRGSIIVDMGASAAFGKGNCQLTQPDQTIETPNGVTIIGTTNLPATVPTHATQALANNFLSLIKTMVDASQLKLDLSDEIHASCVIVHRGEVRHDLIKKSLENNA